MKGTNLKVRGIPVYKIIVLAALLVALVFALGVGCVRGMQAIGWSGVAVSGDALYVGSAEGMLVSIKSDGARAWSAPLKFPAASGGCIPSTGGAGGGGGGCASTATAVAIYGTPVVSGEFVYVAGFNGKVHGFDAPTLEQRWIYPLESYLTPIVGGVAVSGDRLFVGTSDGTLLALDAVKGIKKWEYRAGDKIWTTPAVDKGTVFVTSFDKKLHAVDAATGAKKWEFATGGTITASPLVYNDTVYFGSFDRKLYAVDAATGTQKWTFEGGDWFWATPVASDNTIFAACLDGMVYALKAQTGEKATSFAVGPVASTPVITGSMLITGNQRGELYTIDTVSNSSKRLAEIGVNISAPLVVSKGKVYVHTADLRVFPVDINTGAKDSPISLKKD